MKHLYITILSAITIATANAQIKVNDTTFLFRDSLFMELPEVMVKGERPIVRYGNCLYRVIKTILPFGV